jgi:hypothetical protein
LKAAARACGALLKPPAPEANEVTKKAECSGSEATESEEEVATSKEGDADEETQQTQQTSRNKEKESYKTSALHEGGKVFMAQCPPKTFTRSKNVSKGTIQFFSPCGVKIASFEMLKSESMTILFSALSKIMPHLSPALKAIRTARGMDTKNGVIWNAAKRQNGVHLHRHVLILSPVQ